MRSPNGYPGSRSIVIAEAPVVPVKSGEMLVGSASWRHLGSVGLRTRFSIGNEGSIESGSYRPR